MQTAPQQLLNDDVALLKAARAGDEHAFARLLDRHGSAMLRFACTHTRDRALAEDAVQDAWLGFLRGIDCYEGRSSVRTWLFSILLNRLRTRLQKDARWIPFSQLAGRDCAAGDPALPADRFLTADHPRWPHHWRTPPQSWGSSPEESVQRREVRERIERALETLPAAQRQIAVLRDVEGWSAAEVCELLQISESNQRVLLHRARAKLRRALEQYFREGAS
jgi:RNA polymerase sigma-70 factor, ECF subfamily